MAKNFKIPETILFISRIIVGLVFIFSGFVKGVDPLGFTYKLQDYFTAFNLVFLKNTAFPLSIILILAEFLVGISLFFKLRIKWGAWGSLIFMVIFTPLTLILALTNPVSDCGCFGDAIVITNWQTFWKNLVIIIFTIMIFLGRNNYRHKIHIFTEWSILSAFGVFILGVNLHGLQHLPILDFRPYKVGSSIIEGMEIPDDAPQDEYKTKLIYEKDGIQKEFTEDNFPWQDTSWKFIDQNSILVKEGYKPPVHDFNIYSNDGEELTDILLSYPGYSFLLLSQNTSKASNDGFIKGNELALLCGQNQIPFYCITASGQEEIIKLQSEMELFFDFNSMDETTLKTIVRSNPGLVLIKEGVIIGKWAWKDIPKPEFLNQNMLSAQFSSFKKDRDLWTVIGVSLFLLLLLAVSQILVKNKS